MRCSSLARGSFVAALCVLGCSAGGGASSSSVSGSGGRGPNSGSGGAGSTLGSAASASTGSAGSSIQVGNGDAPGSGGDGANAAEQCDGKLKGYLRDFTIAGPTGMVHDPNAHPPIAEIAPDGLAYSVSPDFEVRLHDPSKLYADDPGIVTTLLGTDSKPVYAGPPGGTPTTTGPAHFATWFHDTPGVNQGQELALQFDKDPSHPNDPNAYTFSSGAMGSACLGPSKTYCAGFYPVDGMLLGNEGNNHNYHLTFELHLKFRYHAGQVFTFKGDDDVWVYVNGKLAVDLGGLHQQQAEAVLGLDTLGLAEGNVYPLDFFWCERHVTASNFHIDTSLEIVDCGGVVK